MKLTTSALGLDAAGAAVVDGFDDKFGDTKNDIKLVGLKILFIVGSSFLNKKFNAKQKSNLFFMNRDSFDQIFRLSLDITHLKICFKTNAFYSNDPNHTNPCQN